MDELEEKKGCVYFLKHNGLNPVKIGYTQGENPLNRFASFQTYAPFGGELIGFIRSINAKELETKLHKKFTSKRLEGEWFDLTIEEVEEIIKLYSSLADIELKNEFQIKFIKEHFEDVKIIDNKKPITIISKYDLFLKYYEADKSIDKTKLSNILNVSRQQIYNYIKKYDSTTKNK
jgi:hypothetical protein